MRYSPPRSKSQPYIHSHLILGNQLTRKMNSRNCLTQSYVTYLFMTISLLRAVLMVMGIKRHSATGATEKGFQRVMMVANL